MKYLLSLMLVVLVCGCASNGDSKTDIEYNKTIQVIVIDTCQYIMFNGYNKGGIIHKENCNNPEHQKTIKP